MTPDESARLDAIYRALMEPAADGDKALIERISAVVKAYERGAWAMRAVLWLLPALAGIGVAYTAIRDWFR